MSAERPRNVIDALAQVSKKLGETGVGKAGYNKDQKFAFRRVDDLIAAVNPLLADQGLVISPMGTTIHSVERFQTKSGTPMVLATIVQSYMVALHSGSGVESFDIQVPGQGADMLDKAIPKALSMAYKYALGQLLHIPFDPVEAEEQGGAEAVAAVDAQEALLEIAKAEAAKGLSAYQAFYTKTCSRDDRALLRGHHEELKKAAKAAGKGSE